MEQLEADEKRRNRQRLMGEYLGKQRAPPPYSHEYSIRDTVGFMLFMTVAVIVIFGRNDMHRVYSMNQSIERPLVTVPFTQAATDGGRTLYFGDIRTLDDIRLWMTRVLLPQAQQREGSLGLQTFNKVIGGSMRITQRRMKLHGENPTDRFRSRYPLAWQQPALPLRKNPAYELTDPFPRNASIDLPNAFRSRDKAASPNSGQQSEWRYGATDGYTRVGGYAVHVPLDDSECLTASFSTCREVMEGLLMDSGFFNPSYEDAPAPHVILLTDFLVYNGNMNTLAVVEVSFTWRPSGGVAGKIDTWTLKVNTRNDFLQAMEVLYLLLTVYYLGWECWYLFRMGCCAYLTRPGCIISFVNCFVSLLSLALWYVVQPNIDPSAVFGWEAHRMAQIYRVYVRASAAALLMILLRFLKYLGDVNGSIKVVQDAIYNAVSPILFFVMLVSVVFAGFVNISTMAFGETNINYFSMGNAIVTNIAMMLGNIKAYDHIKDHPVGPVFLVAFLLFFFFININMINAIINMSYNKQSDIHMSQEAANKKENDLQKPIARLEKVDIGTLVLRSLLHFLNVRLPSPDDGKRLDREFIAAHDAHTRKASATRENTNEDDDVDPDSEGDEMACKAGKVTASRDDDDLDSETRKKVDEYLNKDKKKSSDSLREKLLFLLFGISYMTFLAFNIDSHTTFILSSSVSSALEQAEYADNRSYKDIGSLEDLRQWISVGLPQLIATVPALSGEADSDVLPSRSCVHLWNCFIGDPMLKLTVRRLKEQQNEDTKGRKVIARVRPDKTISPGDALDTSEDTTKDLLQPICSFSDKGGYEDKPGHLCLFGPDIDEATARLQQLGGVEYLSPLTSSVTLEFVLYNGNADTFLYTAWSFIVQSSGAVTKRRVLIPLKFEPFKTPGQVFSLGPFCIYAIMVLYYIYLEVHNIRMEFILMSSDTTTRRGGRSQHNNLFAVILRHYTDDPFNILDVMSIVMSLLSIALWLNSIPSTLKLIDTSDTFFVEINAIAESVRLYRQISSLNVLVICLRLLKFFRGSVRGSMIFRTLSTAAASIGWFVVVLFVVLFGFASFAHISFGHQLEAFSTFFSTMRRCVEIILGDLDFFELQEADSLMAPIFFFSYCLLFYYVALNIFLAIIDRHFIDVNAPPINWKRCIKPYCGWMRCILWEEDYVFEVPPGESDPHKLPANPRKQRMLHRRAAKTENVMDTLARDVRRHSRRDSSDARLLRFGSEMVAVQQWASDEAHAFALKLLERLKDRKGRDPKKLQTYFEDLESAIDDSYAALTRRLEQTERDMHLQTQHYEPAYIDDQATLSQYIWLQEKNLETKIKELAELQQGCQAFQRNAECLMEDTRQQDSFSPALMQVMDSREGGLNVDEGAFRRAMQRELIRINRTDATASGTVDTHPVEGIGDAARPPAPSSAQQPTASPRPATAAAAAASGQTAADDKATRGKHERRRSDAVPLLWSRGTSRASVVADWWPMSPGGLQDIDEPPHLEEGDIEETTSLAKQIRSTRTSVSG
ncbi:unnamed protein product [Vitrella brassicaformis CCMP3155]|uniref:Polycystin cation channel PKD1/PKD2 domain-containing protein n=3 Tax=Vitrella brassicaformis TaxID=1169539 RepID=A0A0G4E8K4_VITBC|nr:unnamed protein product [Vitrella brassicaformis CCMP3155]|eukprot:CEL92129.1 unnamed protein product [Vitrella brassicaformis CCMP3155]